MWMGIIGYLYKRIMDKTQNTNPDNPTCQICLTPTPTLNPQHPQSPNFCPSHPQICQPCFHSYITVQLNTSLKLIKCPFENCKEELTELSVGFGRLPLQMRERYGKVLRCLREIRENFRHCPTCNGELSPVEEQPKQLDCQSCKKRLCKECLSPAHKFRGNCSINVLFQLGSKFKQCPKCRFLVQKSQGCDHMACLCGHHFCYVCGRNRNSFQGHVCQVREGRKRSL